MAQETAGSHTAPRQRGFAFAMVFVFAPFACGYFFSYFYRTVNAVVAPNLRTDIGVNAAELGLLSAVYFLTFAACQIPIGVLLDRYGPRRVQGTLYCLAALGAFLFSLGESVLTLILARALIGIGVSGGLMAALKAIVLWFPKERYALVNGWYLTSGAMGAIAATAPVELALRFTDWRGLFVILAAATLLAAILILLVVPERRERAASGTLKQQIGEIGAIYRDAYFWRIVPLMFTCASCMMAVQGLWAGPWLSEVVGLPRDAVAGNLFLMAAAMAVGVFLSGPYAALLGRFGITLAGSSAIGALLFIVALMLVVIGAPLPTELLWIMIGLLGTMTSLVFAALAQHFPDTHVGRANTAANVMVFAMAFAYQFGMGTIIELWPPAADGSYPAIAYVSAFLAATATMVLAFVWSIWPLKGRY